MLLSGRWWKLAYDQIHDNDRTKARSAKASKKGFLGFCFKFHEIADQVRDELYKFLKFMLPKLTGTRLSCCGRVLVKDEIVPDLPTHAYRTFGSPRRVYSM